MMAYLRIVVLFAFLAGSHATQTFAEHRAQEWMRMHAGQDPDQEGLDELKATNPEAFSIVQALLTKRSLGLLNAKHPDTFDGPPPATSQAAQVTPRVSEPLAAVEAEPPKVH